MPLTDRRWLDFRVISFRGVGVMHASLAGMNDNPVFKAVRAGRSSSPSWGRCCSLKCVSDDDERR